jgi:hypothetical protein
MLLVGIGGVGSKIAAAAGAALECKCLLISNDKKDLVHNDRCTAIFVRSGEWVNPSSYKLRSFVESHRSEMAAAMRGYSTVLVVSNLAGRAGTAIAPLVCRMAKKRFQHRSNLYNNYALQVRNGSHFQCWDSSEKSARRFRFNDSDGQRCILR